MDMERKKKFMELWQRFLGDAELPLSFYYSDEEGGAEKVKAATGRQCFIGALTKVRKGQSLCFDADAIGCRGGKRYLGFSEQMVPRFEYFLSCGIPGKLEGERYKKSPELVKEMLKYMPAFKAPAPFIVFKRWDKLESADKPEVVIFFAKPDVLAGVFTLANYDEIEQHGFITPFGSGCSTIVMYPYLERAAKRPRAVLGMFDVSARPFVPEGDLTLAIPMSKFDRMIDNMEESFFITSSWEKVRKRITRE
jgi:uncharacterized protein (DUF169 family)